MSTNPLDEQIAELVKIGIDAYDNGTILVFKTRFRENPKIYTYAALKESDKWFISGSHARESKTWAELLHMLVRQGTVVELSRVIATETIYRGMH